MELSQFLCSIPSYDKKLILGTAECRTLAAKHTLIHYGDKATHLFLLRSGNARYFRITRQGQELLLHWLVPGDVFGLVTLLRQPSGYMGSVQTDNDCRVYVWEHSEICQLAGVYPQLSENALRIALRYISAYSDRHAHLLTKTAEQRMARALVKLGHTAGQVSPSGIQLNITNEQLGGLADVSLFTATRIMRKWKRDGAIRKERGRVFIQSPEKLLADQ